MATQKRGMLCCCVCMSVLAGCASAPSGSTKAPALSEATRPEPVPPNKTQVVIIGTCHTGHHRHPTYDRTVLRDIIVSCRPSAILLEFPTDWVVPQGESRTGAYWKGTEGWATDRATRKLGVPLIPYDMAGRNKFYQKTQYFERQQRARKLYKEWAERIRSEAPDSLAAKICKVHDDAHSSPEALSARATPEVINSAALDRVVKIKLGLISEVIPALVKSTGGSQTLVEDRQFAHRVWLDRNRTMADNILKIADQYRGKRIVVTTGCYHRYILRDLLKDEQTIDLKEYWELSDR